MSMQSVSRENRPVWETSAEERDCQCPFRPDGSTHDLVIVGGGYSGLSAALHAAEAGMDAHVLEANKIGFGGSGRNAGLVNAGSWLPPDAVRRQLGDIRGSRFLDAFSDAPRMVFELIEKHQIRCEVTRTGTIHAAHAPSGYRNLEKRHSEWRKLGAPVELLSKTKVARMLGCDAFEGGLLDKRAGTINPMGYCRGLARAALANGARISTGVRARKLIRERNCWLVVTDKGDVRGKKVFLGTNAYTDDLWTGLNRVFTVINFLQVSTKPLGEAAAGILPERQGLWDTGRIMFSLRKDMSNRIIIGLMGSVMGDCDKGTTQRWARKRLFEIFPDLGDVELEQAWDGKIAMTPDHIPRIHKLAEDLYTAIGYNGRGITTGSVMGKAVAGLLSGQDGNELPLPVTESKAVGSAVMASELLKLAFAANQFCRSIGLRSNRRVSN